MNREFIVHETHYSGVGFVSNKHDILRWECYEMRF